MDKMISMSLEEIKPYPNNPRKNDAAVDKVAESIETFGFNQPIVVDTDGVIIVGHTRRLAAIKLGLTDVPVIVADLPVDKANAYRLADNKVSEFSSWDYEKLYQELQDIDMDMTVLGFEEMASELDLDDFFDEEEEKEPKEPKIIICPHCGEPFTDE